MELLPPWPLFSAFMAASLVLAITPGPGVIYIVTRSVLDGRKAGLASVLGVALGNLTNALAAAFGLAALFAVSSLAFTVVKYAGGAYLLWLGIRMLMSARNSIPVERPPVRVSLRRVARDGFIVAALNPKTALFFAAFLPQFLHPSGGVMEGTILLGIIFVVLALLTDGIYALLAGSLAGRLASAQSSRHGRQVGGGVLVGLGLFTAASGSRADD
jgi:threonine/homoserine/homoserine lactone efflux protein